MKVNPTSNCILQNFNKDMRPVSASFKTKGEKLSLNTGIRQNFMKWTRSHWYKTCKDTLLWSQNIRAWTGWQWRQDQHVVIVDINSEQAIGASSREHLSYAKERRKNKNHNSYHLLSTSMYQGLFCALSHISTKTLWGRYCRYHILQMKKLRDMEVKNLGQDHTSKYIKEQGFNPGRKTSLPIFWVTVIHVHAVWRPLWRTQLNTVRCWRPLKQTQPLLHGARHRTLLYLYISPHPTCL